MTPRLAAFLKPRMFWHGWFGGDGYTELRPEPSSPEDATLVSSLGEDGLHYPAIDIDHEVLAFGSSTPGHYHLYINKGVEWESYKHLLVALAEAGIVETNYVNACITEGATWLRPPWVQKGVTHDKPGC